MPISEIVSAGASTYLSFAHAIPRKHAQAVQRPRALVWSTSRVLRQGCRVFEPVFGKVMIGHVCQSFSFSDDAMFELGVEVYSFATFFSPPGRVIEKDEFTKKLYQVYQAVCVRKEHGRVPQKARLGLLRSDYMVDTSGDAPSLLQVELNTVSVSFAGLSGQVRAKGGEFRVLLLFWSLHAYEFLAMRLYGIH